MQGSALKAEVAETILLQLMACLKILEGIGYAHGEPCARSLLFHHEPCSYRLGGALVSGPLTLQLCNYYRSSLTTGDVRLAAESKPLDALSARWRSLLGDTKRRKRNRRELIFLLQLRHLDLPLMRGGLDLYCFMVSLMGCSPFYLAVQGDERLLSLWKALWSSEQERGLVEQRLSQYASPEGIEMEDIPSVLDGLSLGEDALARLWNARQ
jgi:hypothetical protein